SPIGPSVGLISAWIMTLRPPSSSWTSLLLDAATSGHSPDAVHRPAGDRPGATGPARLGSA
ncbi:hypothetical protein AB0C29_29160, partial [Actinoplanes sp. NPDC048791]|uniref:hypothetical protein n=1 Tax=Actinoplanes sp. NPDC048791 TaxID=3154623 RepID=UPI0033D398C9